MPHSLCQLYVHMIFSTKHRVPFLTGDYKERAHGLLASQARQMGCPYIKVGGISDHIHIFVDAGKNTHPVKLLTDLKRESSKEIKTWDSSLKQFYWQTGYGLFSVSPLMKERVKRYIEEQEKHHKKMTFQEEYLKFLNEYKINYDEKYLWD